VINKSLDTRLLTHWFNKPLREKKAVELDRIINIDVYIKRGGEREKKNKGWVGVKTLI